jgi:hypothetical protein
MNAVRTGITPIAWLIAPSALLFALFFFLPMGLMAMISLLTGNPVVQPNVDFTTKYYRRILDDSYYFEVIWTTIRIGLLTTFSALLIGYPLAHWMARVRGRTAYAMLMMAVLTPMLTGIVVRTFAWMALLRLSARQFTARPRPGCRRTQLDRGQPGGGLSDGRFRGPLLCCIQSLRDVCDQVGRVLDADRQPDRGVENADLLTNVGRNARVGHGGRQAGK